LGELVAVVGSEVEGLVAGCDLERNDVPEVDGNEIDGEDVELAGQVMDASLANDVAGVRAIAAEGGGLDLDAHVVSVVLDSDVVAGGVSVRTGDAHAASGGASHETELGPLTTLFAACDGTSILVLHVIHPWVAKKKRGLEAAPDLTVIFIISIRNGEVRHVCQEYI
jgi:hypothetical protein